MEIAHCEEIPRSRILSLPQSWFLCVMCFQGASQPQLKSFPSVAMSSSFSQLIPWLPTLTEKPTGHWAWDYRFLNLQIYLCLCPSFTSLLWLSGGDGLPTDWAFTCVLHQWPWPPLLSWTLIVPLSLWRRLKLLILIVFIWHCNLFSLPPLLVPPKPDFWKGNCWLGFPATCQPSAAWFLPHPHHHGSSYWPAFTTVWWAADSSDAPNQSGPPLLPKAYSLTSMATCFLHPPITRLTGNSDGSPASSISLVLLPIVTVHASHQIQNGSSSPVTTPFILLVLLLPG